ncbi:MAG: AzlD domain-containing protein [Pseudomonadota bacterium]
MPDETATWLAIGLVAAVTLACRLAGPVVMSRIGPSPRIERFLQSLSISVIAALVASIVAQGGPREGAAVGVAALVMLATKSTVLALLAGMATAASWTILLSG